MGRIVKIAAAMLLAASPAIAADFDNGQESSTFSWTGGYAGGAVGYRFGQVDWTHNENIGTDEDFSVEPNSLIGGVHVGYQHQFDSLVVGAEAAFLFGGGDDARSSGAGAINPGNPRLRTAVLSNVFSLSARVGYAKDAWHIYGKAGVAMTDIEINHRRISNGFLFPINEWENEIGYTLGAGVEHKITEKVSIGLDYSYFNFDAGGFNPIEGTNCNGALCGDTIDSVEMNIVAGRINFHF